MWLFKKKDTENQDAITLANVTLKFAMSGHDSGLFRIQGNTCIAIFNGFEEPCRSNSFMETIYQFTAAEIDWLRLHGRLEDETMSVRIDIGKSALTFQRIVAIMRENNRVFSSLTISDTQIEARISG